MTNKDPLKELWLQQSIQPPQLSDIYERLKEMRRKKIWTLLAVNFLMVLTVCGVIFIWLHFQPRFITTKIGIVITILGIVVYLLSYNQLLPFLLKINDDKSSHDYLESLLHLRKRQKYLQTKMLGIYFLTLSVGICLYLYEYVSMMAFPWSVMVYAFTSIWIGFNWFVLRPKIILKENTKLNSLIDNVENINNQF